MTDVVHVTGVGSSYFRGRGDVGDVDIIDWIEALYNEA